MVAPGKQLVFTIMTGSPQCCKLFSLYVLTLCFWMTSLTLQAQLTEKGSVHSRKIGQATFGYRVDSSGTGILCSFRWKDSLVGLTHLVKSAPNAKIIFGSNRSGDLCELALVLPGRGAAVAQLVTKIRTQATSAHDSAWTYHGVVAAWLTHNANPNTPIDGLDSIPLALMDSMVFPLTPILRVVTLPKGAALNCASVSIYSGPVLMYTVTLTQSAPFVTVDSALVLGEVKIAGGMQLTLRIPSNDEPGSVQLNAVFSSTDIPPTPINTMIATWNL